MLPAALVALAVSAAPLDVAVLYFDNHTGKPEFEVLRKGLADLLVTDLAQLPGLRVVEREKLQELTDELDRQQTRYFDPRSAQKVGRMLGASHAVTGAMVALAPTLRLDVRLVEVATARVVLARSVTGKPEEFFKLEEELVRRFAEGLGAAGAASVEPVTGRAGVPALLAYSQGLELADRGDLKGAQDKLGEVVRTEPGFTRARAVFTEVMRRLREAQKRRGSAQAEAEAALERSLQEWNQKRLSDFKTEEEAARFLSFRAARVNLALFRLRQLLGVTAQAGTLVGPVSERRDRAELQVAIVPPSKQAQVARLEVELAAGAEQLVADLREYRKRGRVLGLSLELPEEDRARSEALAGVDLGEWSFATVTTVAAETARFLVTGETPFWSEVAQFVVRPVPAERDPGMRARAGALFDAALAEAPLDWDADQVPAKAADVLVARGEGLLLAGRPEEALAQWQLFLDRYPKAEDFPRVSQAIEDVLLASEAAERDQRWVKDCGVPDGPRLAAHARRLHRAQGAAGVRALVAPLRACAKRSAAWAPFVHLGPAMGALAEGDCKTYRALRDDAVKAKAPFSEPPHGCDAP